MGFQWAAAAGLIGAPAIRSKFSSGSIYWVRSSMVAGARAATGLSEPTRYTDLIED
jgi:hypothetical protein